MAGGKKARARYLVPGFLAGAAAAYALAATAGLWPRSLLLGNTAKLALGVWCLSVPIGMGLGLLIARTDLPGRMGGALLLGGLMATPLYLQCAAWQAGFGVDGWFTQWMTPQAARPWLEGWVAAIWIHGVAAVPWIALFVGVAARTVPPELEEVALLDGSAGRVFAAITLRQAAPAIALGALWVGLTVAGEMTVTDFFVIRTYAEEVYTELNVGNWAKINAPTGESGAPDGLPGVAAGGVLMCITIAAGWMLSGALAVPPRGTRGRELTFSLGKGRWPAAAVVWVGLALMLGVPLASLMYKAGLEVAVDSEGARRVWSGVKLAAVVVEAPRRYAREFGWSLAAAGLATAMALAAAIPLAFGARRGKWQRLAVMALATAGLAIPGPLVGLGLVRLFDLPGWSLLNYLADRTVFVTALGQAIRAGPVTLFLAWQAMQSIPAGTLEAAEVDGAGPWRRLALAARMRWRGLACAAGATWVLAMGELPATLVIVPAGIDPLSRHIFGLLHANVEDQAAGICLALIGLHGGVGWGLFLALRNRAVAGNRLG